MAFTVMFILYSHFNYTINQFHTVGYGGKRMADNYDNGDKDADLLNGNLCCGTLY